jgi:hypothetical protein
MERWRDANESHHCESDTYRFARVRKEAGGLQLHHVRLLEGESNLQAAPHMRRGCREHLGARLVDQPGWGCCLVDPARRGGCHLLHLRTPRPQVVQHAGPTRRCAHTPTPVWKVHRPRHRRRETQPVCVPNAKIKHCRLYTGVGRRWAPGQCAEQPTDPVFRARPTR